MATLIPDFDEDQQSPDPGVRCCSVIKRSSRAEKRAAAPEVRGSSAGGDGETAAMG
jgi:hypothetical protein